ncbi:MAG: segregation/condensation protein A [Candidatus Omnitrophota bacterium]
MHKVNIELFEGPLDLLLYLIKKEEVDIMDIPIAQITEQYLEYLEVMQLLDLEIAGEFLVMAAELMRIKSRMLLPPEEQPAEEEEEADPRAELVRRLLEYQKFKEAAKRLGSLESARKEFFTRQTEVLESIEEDGETYFETGIFDLIAAFSKVMQRLPKKVLYEVTKDEFTVEEKIHEILHRVVSASVVYFSELFEKAKNRFEIVTIFLAILELIRLQEVVVRQKAAFGEIEILRNADKIRTSAEGKS